MTEQQHKATGIAEIIKKRKFSFLSKLSMLKSSLWIFATAILLKAVLLSVYSKTPSDIGLLSVHGEIQSMFLGGNGKATWLTVKNNEHENKYYSFSGKVWPGMFNLKKGDIIDITAWEKSGARDLQWRREYWIWKLGRGSEIIVNPEDVKAVKEQMDNDINQFSNLALLVSGVLLAFAAIRHFRSQSERL